MGERENWGCNLVVGTLSSMCNPQHCKPKTKPKNCLKLSNEEGKATYSKRKYIHGARSEGRGNEYEKA